MGFQSTPSQKWDGDQVEQWLASISLPQLAPAFRENSVVGADLSCMTSQDLMGSFGCTNWQAKKIQTELSKIGAQAATGYPAATMMAPSPPAGETRGACEFSPPPAGYPAADYYAPPPPPLYSQGSGIPLSPHGSGVPLHQHGSGVPLSPHASSPMALESSKELEDLKAELAREKLKNDLRQEMDTSSRLAAMEAAGRSASAPTVVSNNNNNNGGGAAKPVIIHVPAPQQPLQPMIVGYEKYCGASSWWIGCCLFPCICCCPVDSRPLYSYGMGHPPVPLKDLKHPSAKRMVR